MAASSGKHSSTGDIILTDVVSDPESDSAKSHAGKLAPYATSRMDYKPESYKMADEQATTNPDSSLMGYRSIPNDALNPPSQQGHVNEGFDDKELRINSSVYQRSEPRMEHTKDGIGKKSHENGKTNGFSHSYNHQFNGTVISNMHNKENGFEKNGKSVLDIPSDQIPNNLSRDKKKKGKKKDEKKEESEDKDNLPPVSFIKLFRYSSRLDRLMMFFGTIIAIVVGSSLPLILILFGHIVDNFVYNDRGNFTSSTMFQRNYTDTGMSSNEIFLRDTGELCMYIAIIGGCVFCFNYIMVSFYSMTAANQAFKIRCLFMKSVLKQDIGWYDTNETGDFASRITADLNRIQDGIGEKVAMCISFLASTCISLIVALYYGWKLTLVILCVMPILSLAMGIISKIQAKVSGDELASYGMAGAVAEEVLSSIRTVVAFGGEKKEIERYDKYLQMAKKKGVKRGLLTSIGAGLIWFCIYCGYALAFWYGVKLIVEDFGKEEPEYRPSTLIIVFFNVMTGAMGMGQTAPYFEAFSLARGAAAKVYQIIERVPPIDSSSDKGVRPATLDGAISIEDVYFSYPARPDVPILNGLSLKINPGESVALVGPSGCGKSTVVQLIQRFYDAIGGKVVIDKRDVKDLNVGWLRDNIGVVGQEPILFSTTIAENILYGKVGATQEDVEKAAKAANAHDFISALPLRYNTLVGERGTQLSGGQKQRIAIARALIRNPKILLLDEATSALDTESESIVQAALDQARQGRTTLIVAHRLSTIRTADKIVVLSGGTVKEIGTHDELMELKGLYHQLVTTQIGEEQDDEDDEERDDFDEEETHDFVVSRLDRHGSFMSSVSVQSDDTLPNSGLRRSMSVMSAKKHAVTDPENEKDVNPPKGRLLKMCAAEWPYILVGGICAMLMGLCIPGYGILFGDILGVLSEDNDTISSDMRFYCLIFVGLGIGSGIATFLQTFMFSIAGERLTARLRKMTFTTIISQDMSWFDLPHNGTGNLCSRLSSDASSVQGATGSRISTALQSLSTLIAAIVIALFYNWKLGLVVLAFIPLVLLATYFESRIISGHMLSEKSATEDASKVAIEAIESIRTVASLHQEETFYVQFRSALITPHKKSRRNSHIRGLTYGFAQSIPSFAYSAATYYGSILVAGNELPYADLFKVIEGVILGTAMVGQAVAFAPDYQKAKVAAVRIFRLLDLQPKINAFSTNGVSLSSVKGNIEFRGVRFNYPTRPRVKILRGLNLKIKPGQTVALVGSSGCGKSTCVQLLERFYDAAQGEVLLDSVNVKDMQVSALRSQIGLVSQEPILFSYSLAENIAYGDNSRVAQMDEIITAARNANIHNFISSLPQGYDTTVGDKGTQLSGGQKQRIAIARALLRNPKILLLDEATSALDAESEKVVQEALDKASDGRTCITIAHRLSTIQNADMIVVIHRGRIVEKGTHQELLARRGHYYNLHNTQCGIK